MLTSRLVVGAGDGCSNLLGSRSHLTLDRDASTSVERHRGVDPGMAYLRGTPRMLPDQPVPTIDPEVERLAHVMVDGLIARLAAEPVVPATSLLDNLADQLQQANALLRIGSNTAIARRLISRMSSALSVGSVNDCCSVSSRSAWC